MIAPQDDPANAVRTALNSLKPLESFAIKNQARTILVACMEVDAYAISCWCKEPELATNIQSVLQSRDITTYLGAKNQKGRVSVVSVVSNTIDGEFVVMNMAVILGLSPKPTPVRPLITTSRINIEGNQ